MGHPRLLATALSSIFNASSGLVKQARSTVDTMARFNLTSSSVQLSGKYMR